MRSADRVRKCLLFGIDRTYRTSLLHYLVGAGEDGSMTASSLGNACEAQDFGKTVDVFGPVMREIVPKPGLFSSTEEAVADRV